MAVPKRKSSKSKIGNRRSHDAIGRPTVIVCPHCQQYTIPHHVCPSCGWYKNAIVYPPKIKKKKEENSGTATRPPSS